MQKQILGAQKVAEEQSKPLNDNVAKLEREIKSFVTCLLYTSRCV